MPHACLSALLCLGWGVHIATAQLACVPQVWPTTSLTLAWDSPTPTPGATLTGWVLERQRGENAWMELPAPSIFENATSDSDLQAGETYFYRIRVTGVLADGSLYTSGFGTESVTDPPCVTVVEPHPPSLGLPQNFQAVAQ